AGWRLLVDSAPAHVAKVRELVIDALTPDQLRQLRAVSERILERIGSGPSRPGPARAGEESGLLPIPGPPLIRSATDPVFNRATKQRGTKSGATRHYAGIRR